MRFRRWWAAVAIWSGLALLPAQAVDFNGGGAAIPDNNPNGVNISFNVTGLTAPVERVRVSITMNHTFAGDLVATLRSPFGISRLVLFGRVGLRRSGNSGASANLDGTYVFSDLATGDLWASAAGLTTGAVIPPGSYRTSTAGAPGLSDIGGCTTRIAPAFAGHSGQLANGTWTLNIADLAGGDVGNVTATVLSIDPDESLFASGFEGMVVPPSASATTGSCRKTFYDYDGNGLSDYVVTRNTGGGPGGAITWFLKLNDGTANGALQSFSLGNSNDVFLEGDFDGDGRTDGAVWRPSEGRYLIRRSSRDTDNTYTISLGAIGDTPTHVGDYDRDGITDAAVYRPGVAPGAPSQTLIRLSSNGQIRALTTGESGAFPSGAIDFSGDGRADVVIQSNAGGGVARFRHYDGQNGNIFQDFNFGTPSDIIMTGSHSGDARGDTTVVRGISGVWNWTTRDGATSVIQPVVPFGNSGTDFLLTGNYDGDLFEDYAVWRPSANPGESKFIVRRSSSPATPFEVNHGVLGDYPVAASRNN